MSLTPEQIAQAGPWAVVVAILLAGIGGLWWAFVREVIVTGARLRREERRSRRLEAQIKRDQRTMGDMAKRLASRADRRPLSADEDPLGFHD